MKLSQKLFVLGWIISTVVCYAVVMLSKDIPVKVPVVDTAKNAAMVTKAETYLHGALAIINSTDTNVRVFYFNRVSGKYEEMMTLPPNSQYRK